MPSLPITANIYTQSVPSAFTLFIGFVCFKKIVKKKHHLPLGLEFFYFKGISLFHYIF